MGTDPWFWGVVGAQNFERPQGGMTGGGHEAHPADSVSSFKSWEDDAISCGSHTAFSLPCDGDKDTEQPRLTVFSGGTAFNSVAGVEWLGDLLQNQALCNNSLDLQSCV